eukprot:XP_024448816.1 protein JINGUBANG-like [Populus trichocarpa]
MRVRSWLASTCATNSTLDSTFSFSNNQSQPPKHLASDTSSSSNSTPSTTSTATSSVSLQSNLSLQTLPSVPSLQKITPETLNVSSLCINSLKPQKNHLPITCLVVQDNLLYAASSHEINVYDRTNLSLVDSFNDKDSSLGSVKSVSFCDGKIFTAHQDCKIRAWKISSTTKHHKLVTVLPTLNDRLRRFVLPKNYVNVRRHKKLLWINTLMFGATVNEKRHVLVATLEKHKSAVNALALKDDGSVLFSGACDRSILVWEREDSANHMVVTGALRGHNKAILSLINVSDLLLSGSADRTVRIWSEGHDGKYICLSVLDGHRKPVKTLAAVRDNDNDVVSVFSGTLDGEIKKWQLSVSPCSQDIAKMNL